MSKLFTEPKASHLESLLKELVSALNDKRQALLDRHKVGELEVKIIAYLDEQDQKKMKEVGDHFSIKLSTLTSTIDKLEKGKLVKRKNSKDDRRVIFIKPTPKGQELLENLDQLTAGLAETILQETPKEEYTILIKGLAKIKEIAGEEG